MKNSVYYLSMFVLLCGVYSCQPGLQHTNCNDFNSMQISGPTIAYLDSSFTLKVPSLDFVSYDWGSAAFTQPITGESEITISNVGPEHATDYNLIVTDEDCGERTLTHTVEVRPKPFATSPCNNPTGKMKVDGVGTYTINSLDETSNMWDANYGIEATCSGGSCTIRLGQTTKPEFDQVWGVGLTADYNTAEVQFRAGSGLNCVYNVKNTLGRLYVKKVTGGTEYSVCGLSVGAESGCSGFQTTAEIKFFMAD